MASSESSSLCAIMLENRQTEQGGLLSHFWTVLKSAFHGIPGPSLPWGSQLPLPEDRPWTVKPRNTCSLSFTNCLHMAIDNSDWVTSSGKQRGQVPCTLSLHMCVLLPCLCDIQYALTAFLSPHPWPSTYSVHKNHRAPISALDEELKRLSPCPQAVCGHQAVYRK